MSRTAVVIIALVAFGLGAGAGVAGFLWATGGDAEPSRDTSEVATTLSLNDPTPEPDADEVAVPDESAVDLSTLNARIDALAEQMGVEDLPDGEATISLLEAKLDALLAANGNASNEDAEGNASAQVVSNDVPERALYRITEDGSEVRFKIDEELSGNPTEVVGKTRRVAGDVIIDFENPSASQLGTIAINVRTMATDNQFRDQAIRSRILQSSQAAYEFVTFTPTSLAGLPEDPVNVGDTVEFQIVGDLTIRDTVREVVFDATVNLVSEDRIEGSAVALVMYSDFGISIQAPPQVANIGDEVDLEIDFVATRVEE